MFFNDFPESAEVRGVGGTFVHEEGGAIGERAVDDVAMAGDPADVGGAPIDVFIAEVENVFRGGVGAGQVTAAGVEDPFRFSGGSGRVKDEERMFGIESRCGRGTGLAGDGFMPPDVAADGHVDFLGGAFEDDDFFDRVRADGEGGIDVIFQWDDFSTAPAAIGGDDKGRSGIGNTVGDGGGGKPAKNHAVYGAEAGAGQHGNGGFRHHGHVNNDPVFGLNALGGQHVGCSAYFAVKLGVSQGAGISRLTFKNDGSFVAPQGIGRMAIDAIFSHIELATDEPFGVRRLPLERFGPLFLPC